MTRIAIQMFKSYTEMDHRTVSPGQVNSVGLESMLNKYLPN
jgi:hypothetical protein